MTSEDVIHSFYIPAFRVKADVVPGPLQHALVHGDEAGHVPPLLRRVLRHEALGDDRLGHRRWSRPTTRLAERRRGRRHRWPSAGAKLFQRSRLHHLPHGDGAGPRPALDGRLRQAGPARRTAQTVTADEAYIRESILNPQAKVVAGFQPIMPTFQGQVTEEQLLQLIAYIKSLEPKPAARRPAPAADRGTAPGQR